MVNILNLNVKFQLLFSSAKDKKNIVGNRGLNEEVNSKLLIMLFIIENLKFVVQSASKFLN